MDEELRKLERLASLGDIGAARQLRLLRRRLAHSRPKKFYYCLTWNEIFEVLNFNYQEFEESILYNVSDISHEITEEHFKELEEDEDEDEDKEKNLETQDEYRFEVEALCMSHAFRNVLDSAESLLENIVETVNEWALRGIQSAIYERPERHKRGSAVEMYVLNNKTHLDEPAVCFQLYRPFLSAYAEAAYCVHGIGDESLGLRDMKGQDVIRVGNWIAECEGNKSFTRKFEEDLSEMDLTPDYRDLRKLDQKHQD